MFSVYGEYDFANARRRDITTNENAKISLTALANAYERLMNTQLDPDAPFYAERVQCLKNVMLVFRDGCDQVMRRYTEQQVQQTYATIRQQATAIFEDFASKYPEAPELPKLAQSQVSRPQSMPQHEPQGSQSALTQEVEEASQAVEEASPEVEEAPEAPEEVSQDGIKVQSDLQPEESEHERATSSTLDESIANAEIPNSAFSRADAISGVSTITMAYCAGTWEVYNDFARQTGSLPGINVGGTIAEQVMELNQVNTDATAAMAQSLRLLSDASQSTDTSMAIALGQRLDDLVGEFAEKSYQLWVTLEEQLKQLQLEQSTLDVARMWARRFVTVAGSPSLLKEGFNPFGLSVGRVGPWQWRSSSAVSAADYSTDAVCDFS